MKRIFLTGGGTAGHVTPNIALLPALHKEGVIIHYIGTESGIEHSLITKENVRFHPINAGKLRRYADAKNLTDIFRIVHGFFQAFSVLLKLRPNVVFSKGGFVACPVVWAAWCLRIPVVIHESDITPGLANRLSIPFATKICYSFPETVTHLKKAKSVYTGLPVRSELTNGNAATGRTLCGFPPDRLCVLIMGGSQGSVVVNKTVADALPRLLPSFCICHICGKDNVRNDIKADGYIQFEYVTSELPHFFAMADIFVGRSGATTLFELLALKKPSLLIPLALGASRGDQILNAQSFKRHGFCNVLNQDALTVDSLVAAIEKTAAERNAMIEAITKNAPPDGTQKVFEVLKQFL